jgi:hypothetical protein
LEGGGAEAGGEVGEIGGGLEFDFAVLGVHGAICAYVCGVARWAAIDLWSWGGRKCGIRSLVVVGCVLICFGLFAPASRYRDALIDKTVARLCRGPRSRNRKVTQARRQCVTNH